MKKLVQLLNSLKRDTAGKRYLPFVDGIRFMAIIPVVILHASERLERYVVSPTPGFEQELSYVISRGAVGVMIFFALSGFILSMPFAKQYASFSYKTYLKRRLTRLEPPYIFWMTAFGLILLFKSQLGFLDISGHYLASIFYVHNIVYGEFSAINPVAWSLEVEIQYYLLAPFLAMFYFSLSDVKARRLLLLCLTTLFIMAQHLNGWQLLPTRASLLGQLQHFMIGLLMADIYVNSPNWHKNKNLLWDTIGLISIVTLMFTWTEELGKSLIFMLAMLGVFSAALKGRVFHSILTYHWIAIIGGMCYTIYLTHLPLLELSYSLIGKFGYSTPYWVQLTISLIITIPLVLLSSMIFYKYIEQPFMRKGALAEMRSMLNLKWIALKDRTLKKALIMKVLTKKSMDILTLNEDHSARHEAALQIRNDKFNRGFFIAMLFALLLLSQATKAQDMSNDLALSSIKPLDELLMLAQGNMAAIDRLSTSQAKVAEEILVTRKKWLRHFALTAGVNYGNGVVADRLTDGGTDNRLTYLSRQNVTYSMGVNIRLPFSEVTSRKHEIKIKKLEIKRLEGMKQEQRDFIRQEVVRFYKELKSCLKAMELQTEVVEANEVALKVTENYFKAGKTPIEQYRMAVDAKFTSKLEYEKSKNEAWYCMRILSELVGESILK